MPGVSDVFKNIPELKLDESKKKILLIYALGLAFILILYVFFFLSPSLGRLFSLIPEVRGLRMEIKAVRDDLGFEDNFKKRLKGLQDKMGDYENKLSREKEIPMLLENLSKIARKSRVKILGITPISKGLMRQGKAKTRSVYQEVPIAISAQSGFHELGAFINKLENDRRYMQVSNIEIRSNPSNPKRHEVRFVVYAYTFKSGE